MSPSAPLPESCQPSVQVTREPSSNCLAEDNRTMRLLWWSLIAAGLLAAAGCGKEPAENASNTPSPRPPANAAETSSGSGGAAKLGQAELDGVPKAAKAYRLALVVKTRNNPFFTPMIEAAKKTASELGATLEVQSPPQESDKERQFALVQDVTARGVDGILVTPADSHAIVPALKQAQDRGTPVINLDNRVDAPTAASAGVTLAGYVGADNEEGGRLAGKAMIEALNGQGKVAILEGIRGADNAEARKRGFLSALPPPGGPAPTRPTQPALPTGPLVPPGASAISVVASESAEWDTQKAYAKFQAMLAAHPDLNGLFCANDKMALGAMKAIQEAGKKGKITVVGYDNIPDVQPYLKDGQMYATIEQHPDLMGKYGVRMAVGILGGSIPKAREFLVPLDVIRGGR